MKVKNININSDGSTRVILDIKLDESGSFLQTEESIMDNVNEFGQCQVSPRCSIILKAFS